MFLRILSASPLEVLLELSQGFLQEVPHQIPLVISPKASLGVLLEVSLEVPIEVSLGMPPKSPSEIPLNFCN